MLEKHRELLVLSVCPPAVRETVSGNLSCCTLRCTVRVRILLLLLLVQIKKPVELHRYKSGIISSWVSLNITEPYC